MITVKNIASCAQSPIVQNKAIPIPERLLRNCRDLKTVRTYGSCGTDHSVRLRTVVRTGRYVRSTFDSPFFLPLLREIIKNKTKNMIVRGRVFIYSEMAKCTSLPLPHTHTLSLLFSCSPFSLSLSLSLSPFSLSLSGQFDLWHSRSDRLGDFLHFFSLFSPLLFRDMPRPAPPPNPPHRPRSPCNSNTYTCVHILLKLYTAQSDTNS